jgi:two-component system KDP operon response regulator KdpE
VTTLLVIEDDEPLRQTLGTMLRARQFVVVDAESGEAGLRAVADHRPDLVLLDLSLPGMDGTRVLREIRATDEVPVVVLTVRDTREDKIDALDAGADDYVTKPFDSEELLARVRAALRRGRTAAPAARIVRTGDLEVDLDQRRVSKAGHPIHLTRTELVILEALVANAGGLVTYEALQSRLGAKRTSDTAALRVHVGNLRRKLGDDAVRSALILTEPGIGYRWMPD